LRSAYSRDCEFEADELGFRLAVAARFSPEGAITLMQAVARLEPDAGALGQYFSSHPDATQRIAHLTALNRQLPPPGDE
jgi:predicted Zn-dependent protease